MVRNTNNKNVNKDKTLFEILHIIYRRKTTLIIAVFAAVILAFIYNSMSTPMFEAKGLLKKETAKDNKYENDFYDIVRLQTQDEVETEMELIKTGDVLGRVVDDLKLNFTINSIVTPSGDEYELKSFLIDYPDSVYPDSNIPFAPPIIKSIKINHPKTEGEFYIKKVSEIEFDLYELKTGKLLLRTSVAEESNKEDQFGEDSAKVSVNPNDIGYASINTNEASFKFKWDAPIGSICEFKIDSYYMVLYNLRNSISVSRIGKTNVFEIGVQTPSPFTAKLIANTIIDKFRDARIEQQKQTIQYSFKFVDEQLEDIRTKLISAENNLSNFKASGQFVTINESSRELINFLSTLEAEKLQSDLLLSDYKNKVEDMRSELQSSGYFDQSYLEPEGEFDSNSPFSVLMRQLSDLELRRLELLQKRTENHPDVKNLDEQINLAKNKLASYNQNTLTAYQIIINTLEKKLVKISNLMSKYEVKMELLPAQENKLARFMREKDVFEKMFTLLLDKREEMRMAELSKLQDIIVVDMPKEPLEPVLPRKRLNLIIGFILGSFFGILGIFLLELKDSKLVNIDELEEQYQIPVLALIPAYSKNILKQIKKTPENKNKFVTLIDEEDGFRETYRLLKTKLYHHLQGREKIVLVTSCEENTGKTTIVANLAISMAQENKRVLLIDCDLRKAELSKLFDIPMNSPGLIDFLTNDVAPATYTKILKMIDILPAGGIREDSSDLLNSERMKYLFEAIDTSIYDFIIIDTPPVTRVVDTLVLSHSVREAILIVRPDLSMKEAVLGGIQELSQAKIKIRGIVANAAQIKTSYYYRYRYGYGYGYTSQDNKIPSDKKSKIVKAG